MVPGLHTKSGLLSEARLEEEGLPRDPILGFAPGWPIVSLPPSQPWSLYTHLHGEKTLGVWGSSDPSFFKAPRETLDKTLSSLRARVPTGDSQGWPA